jgi:hypothetical protein
MNTTLAADIHANKNRRAQARRVKMLWQLQLASIFLSAAAKLRIRPSPNQQGSMAAHASAWTPCTPKRSDLGWLRLRLTA